MYAGYVAGAGGNINKAKSVKLSSTVAGTELGKPFAVDKARECVNHSSLKMS